MRPHRHPRWATWTLVGACLLLLLLAACGSDDDDDDSTGSTQPETSTTTEATSTTVAAQGPAEWIEAVRDLDERNQALLREPHPDQLATVYAETCQCWQSHLDTINFLVERDQHIEGEPPVVLWVRHEQTQEATGLVDLTVKSQNQPLRRVDAAGDVVQELGVDREVSCTSYAIRPDGPGGRYRIYTELPLPDCPEGS